MRSLIDIYERALMGPAMSEKEFDMKVFIPKLNEVVKAYGIRYDKENPVPSDDAASDNLFNAAVDFTTQIGTYCIDTNRVMQFSKEEVLDAIKDAPGVCHAGEGRDAAVFAMRKPDDSKMPWFHVGSGIISSTEEYATSLVEAYASIGETNSINMPALVDSIRKMPVTAGTPTEFYATIRGLRVGLEALRRAGRPGLPIMNHHPLPAMAATQIAASAPQFGCRPTDGWLCGAIAEMKINHDALIKAAYLHAWGANVGSESGPMLGGFSGGPTGFAVLCTAYLLMGQLVLKGDYHLNFPIHFRHTCSSFREVLWAESMAVQATSRNIAVPTIWGNYCGAGANTKMYFYESAAQLLCAVTSGAPAIQTPHPAKAVKVDGITPMEAKFGVEVATAAAHLNRKKANEIVVKLLEKYESNLATPPEGSRYQECYDVIARQPREEYRRLYGEVKEELSRMGIPFQS